MTKKIIIEIEDTIAKGFDFQGCDNQHSDYCACATWEDETCSICSEAIEDGQNIQIVQYPEFWWNPEDINFHEVWHTSCAEEAREIHSTHDAYDTYDETVEHDESTLWNIL